ncbi:uncharacterized mitochondrial protein AtMg00810-like [Humulus lupulus]|uniref:uncharacterized mitochondrial protein AtMg00810-like n=1 Tax=Humulus lupulus TaxID=3486 RepID=UPI002B403C8E|nr:uncharacterized mitochondrial protein AtMg00810-like [Humulus lupulus]
MVTIRAFLAVAAVKNRALHKMDVHNAFLHGDLDEEVYMKLPPGFNVCSSGLVCRLKKSLYDYSLFTLHQGPIQLNVLVYVDDLIISGNDASDVDHFNAYLHECFHMKDLGVLKYFLGIEVARNSKGIFLCQRKYTLDIIVEAGLLGSRPVCFPIEQNHTLALGKGPLLADPERYRRLVGHLISLSFTHPNFSYTVHILAQFMQHPRRNHWDAALRTVRYLKGFLGQGILLRTDCELSLTGWCDSDWATCPLTRRSLTGWIVFLDSSLISWKTKKQHTMS